MSHGVDHPVHRVPRDAEFEPWHQLQQWRTALRTCDENRLLLSIAITSYVVRE